MPWTHMLVDASRCRRSDSTNAADASSGTRLDCRLAEGDTLLVDARFEGC
jgi:hypothetical protein